MVRLIVRNVIYMLLLPRDIMRLDGAPGQEVWRPYVRT